MSVYQTSKRLLYRPVRRYNEVNGQQGWIFVDALIGMVILAVALAAMMIMYRQATIANTTSRDYDAAVYIAQQHLENIKRFDAQPLQDGKLVSVNFTNPSAETVNGTVFTTTIAPVATTEDLDNHLHPYQATVTWMDRTANPPTQRQIRIVAYYYSDLSEEL